MSIEIEHVEQVGFKEATKTVTQRRPRFEGSNICTWIGFKHVMYLVEEGILEHFRQSDLSPRQLFEDHGLCLEIVDSDVRILHALHMDDLAEIEVIPATKDGDSALHYKVTIHVERYGEKLKAAVSNVAVLFKVDDSPVTAAHEPVKVLALELYTVDKVVRGRNAQATPVLQGRGLTNPDDEITRFMAHNDANTFIWKWRIPYFYCHFTERMQHSGYLRLMEEVEDLFLADRGISIRTMLHENKWIPVVPHAQVEILEEAYMEETIYTVYTVEEVYKEYTYSHRMDCYVVRNGQPIKTATGRITHGYAVIDNRRDWSLVTLDDETLAAVKNPRKQVA